MRKGISPLIASVLLIVFTVAAGAFILNWLINYNNANSEKVDKDTESLMNCSGSIITLENVKKSNGQVTLYVANTGTNKVYLKEMNMYDKNGNSCTHDLNSESISAGGFKVVTFTEAACDQVSNTSYITRVTNSCGKSDSYEVGQ